MSADINENKESDKRKCVFQPMKAIKLTFYVLCIFGLIYQVTTLAIQYLQYKTVVNIQFESIKYNRMPAITICYPEHISMNKTVAKYPELRPLFDEYKNLLTNVSKDDYYNEEFQNTLNSIYENFTETVESQDLTVSEYYELMFDYEFDRNTSLFLNEKISRPIDVEMYGLRRIEDGLIDEFNITDIKPIRSRFGFR